MTSKLLQDRRWWALYVLCLGDLMIVLDTTIVNVALPSIRNDLQFSESSLVWVVNAYMLTFGGFLLLGGRLGDLFGYRRLYLIGIVLFTISSLGCGLAHSQAMLIAARAIQGVGGAVVTAAVLALTMNLFTEPAERAKAMGIFGFVGAGGGSVGVLLGGVLTGTLSWHWIFLVNIPLGVVVYVLSLRLLGRDGEPKKHLSLDMGGALTVTASLMLAVYAIVNGNASGWRSVQTLGLLALAVVLLIVFMVLEARAREPLMPLSLFRRRNLATASIVAALWIAAMFAWFFMSALFMQLVLGYDALHVGLGFVPSNIVMAAFSFGLSAKIVMKFGIRAPLFVGLMLAAAGIALLARAPIDGTYIVDVLPATLLLGIGGGIAFNPLMLAAMNDVEPADSGLASGLLNTAFMMGGAVGLAVLVSLAAARTERATAAGVALREALTAGYSLSFIVGAIWAAIGALLGLVFIRETSFVASSEGASSPH